MTQLSTAQGRFFVLETPQASPAHCGICGYSGSERRYLDPRLDFEFYGTLIFCDDCIMSMAQQFGYIKPAQAQALESRVEEAEAELVTLRAAVINLENLSDSLSALGFSRNDSGTGDLVSDSSEGADSVSEESVDGSESEESGTSESTDESGSDDVRDVIPSYDPFADLRT